MYKGLVHTIIFEKNGVVKKTDNSNQIIFFQVFPDKVTLYETTFENTYEKINGEFKIIINPLIGSYSIIKIEEEAKKFEMYSVSKGLGIKKIGDFLYSNSKHRKKSSIIH